VSGARWSVLARGALLAALAMTAACKSEKPRTEVMLEIDADTEVRARLDTLRILVDVSDDDGETWQKRLTQSFDRDDVGDWRAFAWPARLGLVPEGNAVDRKFAVRVQAVDRAGALYVWQQGVAGFERGRTQVLRMTLSASCMVDALDCGDPKCVGTKDCQTCRRGECVSVELLALENFDPKVKSDAGMMLGDAGGEPDRDSGEHEPDGGSNAGLDAGPDGSTPAGDAGADAEVDAGADAEVDAGNDGAVPLGFRVTATLPTADDPVQTVTDGAVSVTFSDPVDQASITSGTMTVSGDGRPLAGTLTTTARGAKFTPSTPWMLAGSYTLKLTSGIKSADDEALEAFSFDFTIRDGEWTRKAEFDGLGDPIVALASDGFGVMEWSHDTGGTPEILASTYEPATGFSAPATLTSQGAGTSVAAANVRHSAIAVWSGISAGQNSSLYTASGGWTTGYGVSPASDPSIALSDSDEVFYVATSSANSNALTGYQYTIGAANPQPISVGSSATGNTGSQLVILGGVGHLAWIHTEGSANVNQLMTGKLDGTLGANLTDATKHNSNPRLAATRTHASAILVWQRDDPSLIGDDSIWASRVTTTGVWSMPVQISTGTGAAVVPAVALDDHGRALVTWQQGGALVSASYDPTSGWSTPVTISASDAMNPDPASVGVQPDGSGLAVWTQDNPVDALNEVWFARYIVGSGWQAASIARISDNDAGTSSVVSLSVDSAGRALAAWYQSNKVWVGRFK
jgi:hypothetical protein